MVLCEEIIYYMSTKLTLSQKKDYAATLYGNGLTQQNMLAAKVGVTEKTIGRWVKKYGWESLRRNIPLMKDEQLQMLLSELEQLNNSIADKPNGFRFADSKEADVRRKLIRDIETLEGENSVADVINVAMKFSKWVSQIDFQKGQEVSTLFDGFIKEQLR